MHVCPSFREEGCLDAKTLMWFNFSISFSVPSLEQVDITWGKRWHKWTDWLYSEFMITVFIMGTAVVWMFTFPQIHVEILTPVVMVLGGGSFERWLGCQDEALMNGISTLTQAAQEIPVPSTTWCYSEKTAINEEAGHR